MDSQQKKHGSMDGKWPNLLPVAVTVAKKNAVRLVSAWALYIASIFLVVFAVAYTLDHYHVPVPCSPSSFVLRCAELTYAGAAEVAAAGSVVIWMLWCDVPQAAVAALALLLPCRYRQVRRALAYLALALTIVGHTMCARASLLFYAADPGYIFAGIMYTVGMVFFAVDLLCFLALHLGRED